MPSGNLSICEKVICTNIMVIVRERKKTLLIQKNIIIQCPSDPPSQKQVLAIYRKVPTLPQYAVETWFCRSLRKVNDSDPITPNVVLPWSNIHIQQVN